MLQCGCERSLFASQLGKRCLKGWKSLARLLRLVCSIRANYPLNGGTYLVGKPIQVAFGFDRHLGSCLGAGICHSQQQHQGAFAEMDARERGRGRGPSCGSSPAPNGLGKDAGPAPADLISSSRRRASIASTRSGSASRRTGPPSSSYSITERLSPTAIRIESVFQP